MKVRANGIGIEVDVQGPPTGEAVVLIMGLGMQLVAWPDELVQALVAQGLRVVRLDNRDAGLSDGADHLGPPSMALPMLRYTLHLPVPSAYRLSDLADDTAGVLDALGIAQAHVCGASMGGMVAQHLAVRHAARVKSLTLVMTTTGARHLPQPKLRVRQALLGRPASSRVDDVVAHLEGVLRVIGSPGYPPDPARQRARLQQSVQRAWRPAGTMRQLLAIAADGDRTRLVESIAQPVHVVHGAADPLVPVAAAHQLVRHIRSATLDEIPGMGHDLPLALMPRLADGIVQVARRAG